MPHTWCPAAQQSKKEARRRQLKLEETESQLKPVQPTQTVQRHHQEFQGRNLEWRRVEEQQALETMTGQQQNTSPWPSQPPLLPISQRNFDSNSSTTAMDPGQWWPVNRGKEMGRQVWQITPPFSHHHPPPRGNQGHGDPCHQGYGSLYHQGHGAQLQGYGSQKLRLKSHYIQNQGANGGQWRHQDLKASGGHFNQPSKPHPLQGKANGGHCIQEANGGQGQSIKANGGQGQSIKANGGHFNKNQMAIGGPCIQDHSPWGGGPRMATPGPPQKIISPHPPAVYVPPHCRHRPSPIFQKQGESLSLNSPMAGPEVTPVMGQPEMTP
eukprot:EG_transcript_17115